MEDTWCVHCHRIIKKEMIIARFSNTRVLCKACESSRGSSKYLNKTKPLILEFPSEQNISLRECVYSLVISALRQNGYNKSRTARTLEMSVKALKNMTRKMEERGLLKNLEDAPRILLGLQKNKS